MNTGYVVFFGSYVAMTLLLTLVTERRTPLTWLDSLIVSNGLMSIVVFVVFGFSASARLHVPFGFSPAGAIAILITGIARFSSRIREILPRSPIPTSQEEEDG